MPRILRGIFLLSVLVSVPALFATGAAPDAEVSPEGRWVGVVVVDEGASEVDLVVDLERGEDDAWTGTMAVPVQGVSPKPLGDLKVAGGRVEWSFEDPSGVARFSARVEGDRMVGTDREAGETYPLELRRLGPPGHQVCPEPDLADLSGVEEMKRVFNADAGSTRVLMVVPPNCGVCRGGARLVERHLLAPHGGEDLAAYVVWVPTSRDDRRSLVEHRACDVADPRARHFWNADGSLAAALRPALGLGRGAPAAWGVYLVYGPDAEWRGDQPPAPLTWMHRRRAALPGERSLNALRLAEEAGDALR